MIDCERYWINFQKMQCKTSTNVLWFGECFCLRHWEHLYSWERITQKICMSFKNVGERSHFKQMFDISVKLMVEQSDEIFRVSPINWEDSPWKQLSLVNDEEVNSLSHTEVYVFSDSVLCLGKMNQNPTSNTVCEQTIGLIQRFTTIQNFGHNWWWVNGIRVEIFLGFFTLQLIQEVQKLMNKMDAAQF